MKLESIAKRLSISAEKAIEIVLDYIFDGDIESMERAIDNDELTVNSDVENVEWLNYVDISNTNHCIAIRLSDCEIVTNSDAMSKLFGWE